MTAPAVCGYASQTVTSFLTTVARATVLDPATPLAEAAQALAGGGQRLALVAVDGRCSGVVSASDVARAIELAAAGVLPDRSGADSDSRTGCAVESTALR
jgi:CBS domain-containing protein